MTLMTDMNLSELEVSPSEATASLGILSTDPTLDTPDEGDSGEESSENSDSDDSGHSQSEGRQFARRVALRIAVIAALYYLAKNWVFN